MTDVATSNIVRLPQRMAGDSNPDDPEIQAFVALQKIVAAYDDLARCVTSRDDDVRLKQLLLLMISTNLSSLNTIKDGLMLKYTDVK